MSAAASLRFRLLVSVLSLLLVGVTWRPEVVVAHAPQPPAARRRGTLPGLSAGVTWNAMPRAYRPSTAPPAGRGASAGLPACAGPVLPDGPSRRRSAGELAELFGQAPFPSTARRGFTVFGRWRGKPWLVAAGTSQLVDAMRRRQCRSGRVAGAAVRVHRVARPPQPWQPEDTLLRRLRHGARSAGFPGSARTDARRDSIQLRATMLDFARGGTESTQRSMAAPSAPPVPGPEIIDLRKRKADTERNSVRIPLTLDTPQDDGFASGSNVFALAGNRTASGSALLANDMHLHLGCCCLVSGGAGLG